MQQLLQDQGTSSYQLPSKVHRALAATSKVHRALVHRALVHRALLRRPLVATRSKVPLATSKAHGYWHIEHCCSGHWRLPAASHRRLQGTQVTGTQGTGVYQQQQGAHGTGTQGTGSCQQQDTGGYRARHTGRCYLPARCTRHSLAHRAPMTQGTGYSGQRPPVTPSLRWQGR